jgi:Aerotolerance regulator N-terminal/CARDB
MSFLYPYVLWGLAAVSIPLVIHLFNFRKIKRVYFTNVAFLREVNTNTSSFRRLKHWLILASRMLFVASLILAFAQPFIPSKQNKGVSAGVTNLYIDNSLSMQNESDNKSHLDLAVSKVEELLTAFQGGATQLQLITNNFDAAEHGLNTPSQIKDRAASIQYSGIPRSLNNVLKRQTSLAGKYGGTGGNQYFWFSDFQKSTVGDLTKIKVDTNSRLLLVPIQAKQTQNVLIDSVWLNTPFVREMQSNRVSVKVRNTGNEPVSGLSIKLFLDDVQVASQTISLAANNTGTTVFSFTIKGKGYKKGKISFDDSPITFDNDYYFVLNASPTIEVLHLYGQASAGGYIPKVFANDSIFHFKGYPFNNTDVGLFQGVNLIVLEGVERIEGTVANELQNFVKNGGSLIIIPSAMPDGTSYQRFLMPLGIQAVSSKNKAITPQDMLPLAEPQRKSPFFTDIFELHTSQDMTQMPMASAVWQWQVVGEKLLSFRSGQTYLSSSISGKGFVYMVASPLEPTFGEFARNALFVPTMYKIGALSVRQEPLAYRFSQGLFSVELTNTPTPNTIFKLKQGKIEVVPTQRINGSQLLIEIPKANDQLLEAGYYELVTDGKTEKVLAFNHDNIESVMTFYTPDELRTLFSNQKNIKVFDRLDEGDFVKAFQSEYVGKALWKYFLIAALVFLLIEIALIRLMKE